MSMIKFKELVEIYNKICFRKKFIANEKICDCGKQIVFKVLQLFQIV